MCCIPINGEKLRLAFQKRKLNASYVAKVVGVNSNYFSNARRQGMINDDAMTILNDAFKIPPSEYSDFAPIPNDPLMPISRSQRVPRQDIDSEKLRTLLKDAGIFSQTLLSERMGQDDNAVSRWLHNGKMPTSAIEWLEKHYHIPAETYVIDKAKQESATPVKQLAMEMPEPTPAATITMEELRELIIEAVYVGVRRALNE